MNNNKKITLFVITRSPNLRDVLTAIIDSDKGLKLIGTSTNGMQFIKKLPDLKPDVILMDSENNIDTICKIMQSQPIPIIIVSFQNNAKESETCFEAIQAGALATVIPPKDEHDTDYQQKAAKIIETIKTMAGIQLITRRATVAVPKQPKIASLQAAEIIENCFPIMAVAIGASLGGPAAIASILADLPKSFPVPIFVAQHISDGFSEGLADWLNTVTDLTVKVAAHGEQAKPGYVYIAPDKSFMEVTPNNIIKCIETEGTQEAISIGYLFKSIAKSYGAHAIGVILTGMGRDGAQDLLLMKHQGAYTIAQSEDGCLMFSMPKAAIDLDAVKKVLPLHEIAEALNYLTSKQR